jgi:hypothetical membrane protein
MVTAIVFVLFFLTFFVDFLPNAKKLKLRDSIIYCALLSISFAILMLYSVGITVPGPTEPIKHIVELFIKPE